MFIERSGDSDIFENFWIEAALATWTGKKHTRNEDRFTFHAPGNSMVERKNAGCLFSVIDGCGGYAGGADAAEICAEQFRYVLPKCPGPVTDRENYLISALIKANRAVHAKQLSSKNLNNMAAATTTCWLWEDASNDETMHGYIVHVGDCRAYLYRDDALQLLTRDHKKGQMLTRIIGMKPEEFKYDLIPLEIKASDILLLATDGLWKPHAIDLVELIEESKGDPEKIVKNWVSITRRNGSDDDQTAIAIAID